jgi:hypothetical protein
MSSIFDSFIVIPEKRRAFSSNRFDTVSPLQRSGHGFGPPSLEALSLPKLLNFIV